MIECEGLGRWRIKNELECEELGGGGRVKIKQGCEFSQNPTKLGDLRSAKFHSADFSQCKILAKFYNFATLAKFPSELWTSLLQKINTTLQKQT